MMLKVGLLVVSLAMNSGLALAAEPPSSDDEFGTLNPQELTIDYGSRARKKRVSIPACAFTAIRSPKWARMKRPAAFSSAVRSMELPVRHAVDGLDQENGYDRPSDPVKAAEWNKTLADTGSSLGQFNYGLEYFARPRGDAGSLARQILHRPGECWRRRYSARTGLT